MHKVIKHFLCCLDYVLPKWLLILTSFKLLSIHYELLLPAYIKAVALVKYKHSYSSVNLEVLNTLSCPPASLNKMPLWDSFHYPV